MPILTPLPREKSLQPTFSHRRPTTSYPRSRIPPPYTEDTVPEPRHYNPSHNPTPPQHHQSPPPPLPHRRSGLEFSPKFWSTPPRRFRRHRPSDKATDLEDGLRRAPSGRRASKTDGVRAAGAGALLKHEFYFPNPLMFENLENKASRNELRATAPIIFEHVVRLGAA